VGTQLPAQRRNAQLQIANICAEISDGSQGLSG
jgi:hypothetical protein